MRKVAQHKTKLVEWIFGRPGSNLIPQNAKQISSPQDYLRNKTGTKLSELLMGKEIKGI